MSNSFLVEVHMKVNHSKRRKITHNIHFPPDNLETIKITNILVHVMVNSDNFEMPVDSQGKMDKLSYLICHDFPSVGSVLPNTLRKLVIGFNQPSTMLKRYGLDKLPKMLQVLRLLHTSPYSINNLPNSLTSLSYQNMFKTMKEASHVGFDRLPSSISLEINVLSSTIGLDSTFKCSEFEKKRLNNLPNSLRNQSTIGGQIRKHHPLKVTHYAFPNGSLIFQDTDREEIEAESN